MTRVIAGTARGRRLAVPPSGTRPTSDRAREGLFSALDAQLTGFAGRAVFDLYAGSGALGLEALSRGAQRVDFVESAPSAVSVLRTNLETLALAGGHVHAVAVERWVCDPNRMGPSADVVLLDPPYAHTQSSIDTILLSLATNQRVAPSGIVVVERSSRGADFEWPAGFVADRERRYGEATLWFGRFDSVTAC